MPLVFSGHKTPYNEIVSFHQEVHAFTNYMSPTRAEDEVRGMVVALIQDAIQQAFTDAEVLPFGSFSTKLYLPSGDIDLVIFSQSMQVSSKLAVLQSLAATLKNYGITNKVQIIAKAKIPIVKFVTCSDLGRFNVDISVNQGNGLNALKIIKSFLGKEEEEGMGIALRALVLGKAPLFQIRCRHAKQQLSSDETVPFPTFDERGIHRWTREL